MSRAGRWSAALLVLAAAACSLGEAAPNAADPSLVPAQQAPQRFGFGRQANAARIAAWDIDVRPDGEGLPAGSGTVAAGGAVFQQRCASCHGATGTEGPARRLVGTEPWGEWPVNASVGNYWPYATTLYDYMVRAMPQDAPGSLTANETYAVIAWILNQNKLVPDNAVMDATTLPLVSMPGKDHFVPDDRTGGPAFR